MKSKVIVSAVLLILATPVFAESPGKKTTTTPSPLAKINMNQNQVNTVNQGDDTQLRVATQERESSESAEPEQNPRSQTARDHMSQVATQVEQLLNTRISGGIGDQVRQIARTQQTAQTQIQQQLAQLESKTGFIKTLFGPNYQAINTLNQQIEQNRLRIQQLEQLKTQLKNQADVNQINAVIQTLTQQNTALANQVQTEANSFSLFGWLVKLFHR